MPTFCVYCGEREGVTRDHVIPDCLFVDPKPPNLLTVPACAICNNEEKSEDDTFLRDFLVVDLNATDHPVARRIRAGKVMRSVRRNQSEMAKYVIAAQEQPYYDHEGTYQGDYPKIELPDGRVTRIMSRMARGLYYSRHKQVFPLDHPLVVQRQRNLSKLRAALGTNGHLPSTRVFGNVFGYSYVHCAEPLSVIWLLWFYESVGFSVMSSVPELGPPSNPDENPRPES